MREFQAKEFQVNKFITLKLEEEIISEEEGLSETKTNIYVKGELFRQCSFLLINIPVEEITSLDTIESIDEAEERLDPSLEEGNEQYEYEIPPETEFWGHCSNLQAWVEFDYNTQLIHRYLAFPLLKRLTEVGDPVARRVFKEEIVKRFSSCHILVTQFLFFEDYLDYLLDEELEVLFNSLKEKNELMFQYFEPVLMVRGYIRPKPSLKEIARTVKRYFIDLEADKYKTIKMYEGFNIGRGGLMRDWLKKMGLIIKI